VARPRTLGPSITFRLPVELHQIVVERAEANGETVNDYVRRRFVEALERHSTQPKIGKPKEPVEPRWKESMKK
jgi:Arc-like DNA binding domain